MGVTWLKPVEIGQDAQATYNEFLRDLDARLSDPGTDRFELAAGVLAEIMYGRPLGQLRADAPRSEEHTSELQSHSFSRMPSSA